MLTATVPQKIIVRFNLVPPRIIPPQAYPSFASPMDEVKYKVHHPSKILYDYHYLDLREGAYVCHKCQGACYQRVLDNLGHFVYDRPLGWAYYFEVEASK